MRYPKYLQTSTVAEQGECQWQALAVSTSALYMGGYVSSSTKLVSAYTSNSFFPVIAKLHYDTDLYAWRMAYASSTASDMEQIVALALQASDETKMAVAATKKTGIADRFGTSATFIFVVDTTTGAHVGKLTQFNHGGTSPGYDLTVLSQGLLMSNSNVFAAFYTTYTQVWSGTTGQWSGGLCDSATKRHSRWRIGGLDTTSSSMLFYGESSWYGKSAAILLTSMSPNPIWLAGVLTDANSGNPSYSFSLLRLNEANGSFLQAYRLTIPQNYYETVKSGMHCSIKHFAYDSSGSQFFGTFETVDTSNPGGANSASQRAGVWLINTGTSSGIARDFSGTTPAGTYAANWRIAGMRPVLDSGKIHLIFNAESTSTAYYVMIDLSTAATSYSAQVIHNADFLFDARWIEKSGSPTFQLDPADASLIAKNSYCAGKKFGATWGTVFRTVQTQALSCFNDATSPFARTTPSSITLTLESFQTSNGSMDPIETDAPSFIAQGSGNLCDGGSAPSQTTGILMSSWAMAGHLFQEDAICNSAVSSTILFSTGQMAGSPPYIHIYGQTNEFIFNPPSITSPSCEANLWDYQVIWATPSLISNLSIAVDPSTNKIKASSLPDGAGNYNLVEGDYTFTLRSTLPNGQYSDFEFVIRIESNICTVTAPIVLQKTYLIGDAVMDFTVDDYASKQACGTLTYTNSISPAAGFVNNNSGSGKTFNVQTAVLSDANTYTITITATYTTTSTLTFNLIVIEPTCDDAVITIDETKFITNTNGFTLSIPIWSGQTDLAWTDSNVAVTLFGTPTNCGSLVYAFKNTDLSVFTSTASIFYDLSAKTFSMVSTDPLQVNTYTFLFEVSLQSNALVTKTRRFKIEFTNLCEPPTSIAPSTIATQSYSLTYATALTIDYLAFTTNPTYCPISYTFTTDIEVTDPSAIQLDSTNHRLTISSTDLSIANTYVVTLTAKSPAGTALTPSGSFPLQLVNPCLTATFTIDSTIVSQPVNCLLGENLQIDFLKTKVTQSDLLATCPLLQYDIFDSATSALADSSVFTQSGINTNDHRLAIYTGDPTKVNTYNLQLKVKYQGVSYSYQGIHNFVVNIALCFSPTTFTPPATQTNPATYYYSTTPALFTLTTYTIAPVSCVPTYTCQMAAGSAVDLCSANNPGVSSSTFNTATGDYTLMTIDPASYPPGTYIIQILVSVGDQTQTASFALTLTLPPLVLLASPFSDRQQAMNSPSFNLAFDVTQIAQPLSLLNPGNLLLFFYKSDGTSALDTAVFTQNLAAGGNALTPLTVNLITDGTKAGLHPVVFSAYYENYPTIKATSPPFTINVGDPCDAPLSLVAQTSAKVPDYTYTGQKLSYTLATFVVNPSQCSIVYKCISVAFSGGTTSSLSCTTPVIAWSNSNKVFEFATADLKTYQPGSYTFTYQGETGVSTILKTTNTFVLNLVDPCPKITFSLGSSPFSDQDYLLGSPEIRLVWDKNSLATLSSTINCGDFYIANFFSKDGGGQLPLNPQLFKIDFSTSSITIKGTDAATVGTYTVYFEVALSNYQTNRKITTTPFKVVVTKPNTAPIMSGLATKQATFNVEIPFPPADQIVSVGKTVDNEGDKVIVQFDNNGAQELAFDQASGSIKLASATKEGTYGASLKLQDDNSLGPLVTTYTLTFKVTVALPTNSTSETSNSTDTQASTTSSTGSAAPIVGPSAIVNKPQVANAIVTKVDKSPKSESKWKPPKEVVIPDPEMILESMSAYGVLKFIFTENMFIPNNLTAIATDEGRPRERILEQNLTFIDDKVLHVQIDIAESEDRNNFNFTWNITKFEQKAMELRVWFQQAYYVSIQDTMRVKVLKKEFFVAENGKTFLDKNLDFAIVCKPQIQLGGAAETVAAAAAAADSGTKGVLAANFAMNILLSSALSLLWGMINGLQIVAFMPLANCDMPGNAQFLFQQIYNIAAFNIINVDFITGYFANLFHLEQSSEGVSNRIQAMGFETTNVLMNLGLVFLGFLVFVLVIVVQLVLWVLQWIRCKYQYKLKSVSRAISKKIYWNFYIRFFIETYIDQAFVQALKLKQLKFKPVSEGVSTGIAIAIVTCLFAFPIFNYAFLLRNKKRLKDPEFHDQYEAAYENIRTRSNLALAYMSVFTAKRLTFAAFIMMVENYKYTQTFLILHLVVLGGAYTLAASPFVDPITNKQESFNDLLTFVIAYCLLLFSDLVPDKKTQYQLGWIVCGIIVFQILVNLGFILYVGIGGMIPKAKVYLTKCKRCCKTNSSSSRKQVKQPLNTQDCLFQKVESNKRPEESEGVLKSLEESGELRETPNEDQKVKDSENDLENQLILPQSSKDTIEIDQTIINVGRLLKINARQRENSLLSKQSLAQIDEEKSEEKEQSRNQSARCSFDANNLIEQVFKTENYFRNPILKLNAKMPSTSTLDQKASLSKISDAEIDEIHRQQSAVQIDLEALKVQEHGAVYGQFYAVKQSHHLTPALFNAQFIPSIHTMIAQTPTNQPNLLIFDQKTLNSQMNTQQDLEETKQFQRRHLKAQIEDAPNKTQGLGSDITFKVITHFVDREIKDLIQPRPRIAVEETKENQMQGRLENNAFGNKLKKNGSKGELIRVKARYLNPYANKSDKTYVLTKAKQIARKCIASSQGEDKSTKGSAKK